MARKSAPAKPKKNEKYTAYLCSHTHWDREWYGTFQQYRFRLVRLIDRLMDLLEADPEYRCFNLDGQTIPLEDYLEVKPEQRERLTKLIRDGRIAVGPWYILPDEWLVSGESTVRNMLRGKQVCKELGVQPAHAAYLPDMFGHIGQIPQILKGFGFDSAIMWRGLSGEQWKSELWWESPDGSRVLAFHLPEYCGYCNAAFFYCSLPEEARTRPDTSPVWMANEDPEFAAGALRAVADRAIKSSRSNVLFFMNGVDHMEAQPQIAEIIRRANELMPDVNIKHATYEEFLSAVEKNSPKDLQVIKGEQRSAPVAKESGAIVLPNILSSRIYLKLANAKCQQLLERWAEPFASAAAWTGNKYPEGFLRTGWKWLLRNHPHDSIGGCSIDEVHRNMETRFEWAEDIATTLTSASLYQVTESIDTEALPENEQACFVFNPLNWDVSDLVTLDIELDAGWLQAQGIPLSGTTPYEAVRNLRMTDWAGKPVKFELLNLEFVTAHRPWITFFAPLPQVVRFKVALWAEKVPALGYKGFRVGMPKKMRRLPDRHAVANPARLENENLRVEIQANGTLDVSGKIVGNKTLKGLHYFEDGGDNGDGYTYSPPRHDAVVTSLAGDVQITRLTDSEAQQQVAVDYTLNLPDALTTDRQHRSPSAVPLKVRSVFTLGADSKRIDVETTLTNVAKDHRLRICFPVADKAKTHFAEMQFDVTERVNRIVQPSEDVWMEDMPLEQAQQSFVTYGNLAVANLGLPEYELAEGDPSVLKVTLLRAANYLGAGGYPNTIQGGAGPHIVTPEQQMIGRTLVFNYSLIPHKGDWIVAGVQEQAHQHNALWRCFTTGRHAGQLPADELSFLKIEGENIMLSTVKQVEDQPGEYVVRFWNSGNKSSKAVVKWFRKPVSVHHSNLAEEKLAEIKVKGSTPVGLTVKPKEIVTLRFKAAL